MSEAKHICVILRPLSCPFHQHCHAGAGECGVDRGIVEVQAIDERCDDGIHHRVDIGRCFVFGSEPLLHSACHDQLPPGARLRDTDYLRVRVTTLLGNAERVKHRAFG